MTGVRSSFRPDLALRYSPHSTPASALAVRLTMAKRVPTDPMEFSWAVVDRLAPKRPRPVDWEREAKGTGV